MSRALPIILRTATIAIVLVLLGWLLGSLSPAPSSPDGSSTDDGSLRLSFLSAFVLTLALFYPIRHSRLRGRALFGAVFLAVFGLATVLTLVEAALFLTLTRAELLIEFLKSTINAAVLSALAVRLFAPADRQTATAARGPNPPTTGSWIRRWIGISFVYVLLYITAGLLILPLIRSWYEAQGTLEPDPAFFFPFQLARGALFVAFVLPLLRSLIVTRRQASLALAVMIPLVHGVASLIAPNPFMPDHVRYAHMLEIGWSNFVLGLLIGFLFWKPNSTAEIPEAIEIETDRRPSGQ
jgi:hypothetical protein